MTENQLKKIEQNATEYGFCEVSPEEDFELIAEVRRLKAALRQFGQHADTCGRAHYLGSVPCRCGLDAALGVSE